MNPHWQNEKEIFLRAVLLPKDEALAALRRECSGDPEFLARMEALVLEHFLKQPMKAEEPSPDWNPRFRMIAKVGSGSFGDVYHVYDKQLGREVALKVLRNATPDGLLYFKRERRSLADLRHDNLVEIYELISHGIEWMLTMEFVRGTDFLTYVRTGGAREQRIRKALPQLVSALNALHASDLLHRDLKPRNILVTANDCVKVVDFGLVASLDQFGGARSFVGSPDYMSPEQAAGRPVTPATDWYSLGAILYESLTDRVPFSGTWMEPLWRKEQEDPVPPCEILEGIPADLNALCMGLLNREPENRGRALATWSQSVRGAHSRHTSGVFVGREAELQTLHHALARVMDGTPVIAHLCGRSGIGKSALIREFVSRVRAKHTSSLIFAGRCYQRESVPYPGFDDVVDGISQYLRRLAGGAERFLPRNFHLLTRVFEVLACVSGHDIARCTPTDATEVRARAFGALRDLVGRIAEAQPVVLVIDDLQWANLDTCTLLEELMYTRDAPRVLLVISYRSEDAGGQPWLARLRQHAKESGGAVVVEIPVSELPSEEGRRLARSLATGGSTIPSATLDPLIEESGGDPFLIIAIVEALKAANETAFSGRVDDILQSRVAALDPVETRLLQLISVAGRPTHPPVATHDEALARDRLLDRRFLRSRVVSGRDEIEVYHDRIRQVVLASIDEKTLRKLHAELAQFLEADSERDVEQLAIHLYASGQSEKARPYAIQAGARASERLAFDIAASHYRRALDGFEEGPAKRDVWHRLGEVLSNAGRGEGAAEAYLAASQGAASRDALFLRCEAAGQLLRSGHIQHGDDLLNQLMAETGLWSPRSVKLRLAWLFFLKWRLRLRGLDFCERSSGELPDDDLFRLDVCWTASVGLSVVHPIKGAEFTIRFLLGALDAGDAYRVALGLAAEAAHTAAAPGIIRYRAPAELLDSASRLADRFDDAHAKALVKVMRSVVAYLEGHWRDIAGLAEEGGEMLRSGCTGVAWELGTANTMSFIGRSATGQFAENRRRLPSLIKDAESRGDLFNKLSLRLLGCAYILETAADHPENAMEELRRDVADWPSPYYDLQKCNAFLGRLDIYLYMGQPQAAWRAIEDEWPTLGRSELLRVPTTLAFMCFAHGRVAVAMAAHASMADRKRFLQIAAHDEKLIRSAGPRWASGLGNLVASGIASVAGDHGRVLSELKTATAALREANIVPHLQAARFRIANIGKDGAIVSEIEQWASREGVAKPAKFFAALNPGLW